MKLIYEDVVKDYVKIKKVCLVDADYIKYIAESRANKEIQENYVIDKSVMKQVFRNETLKICEELTDKIRDPIIFCFSGKSHNTFRSKICLEKKYKGNRTNKTATVEEYKLQLELRQEAMEAVINGYVCLLFEDLEADDILSMLQDEDTYIYSRDKDLKQVPGLHLNIETNQIETVTKEDGIRFLCHQMITGDTADAIAGIQGMGPKGADKLLEGVSTKNHIQTVFQAYKSKYGIIQGTDMFAENWMLLKLRSAHGTYFREKYKEAFSLLESIKLTILNK